MKIAVKPGKRIMIKDFLNSYKFEPMRFHITKLYSYLDKLLFIRLLLRQGSSA